MIYTGAILRNQACAGHRPAHAWLKNHENHRSFPLLMFCHIRYILHTPLSHLRSNEFTSVYFHIICYGNGVYQRCCQVYVYAYTYTCVWVGIWSMYTSCFYDISSLLLVLLHITTKPSSNFVIEEHSTHGYYSVFNKYATLVLNHWNFDTDKPLALWAQGLSVVNFLWPRIQDVYLLNTSTIHNLYIT